MREVRDLFDASAASLWGTMTSHSGNAGFCIPDYQRTYDWSEEKIGRLLEDCANGFYYLTKSEESFTFLGTLILVKEKSKETTFDGTSLVVVDGQQRLTTLLLTCCILIELITDNLRSLEHAPKFVKSWIKQEADFQINELFKCAVGQLSGRGKPYNYPRIVRHEDNRAREPHEYEYRSLISRFLMDFAVYYEKEEKSFRFPKIQDEDGEEKRFKQNYEFIKTQIQHISDQKQYEGDIDCQIIESGDFQRKGIQNRFEKLDYFGDASTRNKAVSEVSKGTKIDSLLRLILFASYLNSCVVLTRVETDDENSAFDIFDALNTTGEPLTAIETFKPHVIQFEKNLGRYKGTESEVAFHQIEGTLNERFVNTDERQKETKEIIVTFALYTDGSKESKELSSQRRYLRTRFDKIKSASNRRQFVQNLADISRFRSRYWHKEGIQGLVAYHAFGADELHLCFRFISDMNTSLALPILARYWSRYHQTGNDQEFVESVNALTAFLILRRAVTGTTAGIDSDFRSIMAKKSNHGDPLCVGLNLENKLLELEQFRALLRGYLKTKRIGVVDKKSWVTQVREVPLAQHSRPLAKFLILAAHHHALPDPKQPGLLTRKDVRPSNEQEYLTDKNWMNELYRTVEHVAPDSNPGRGWDSNIYKRPATRHIIGNLVLLPQEENSRAGNSGWARKKLFYMALMEKNKREQKKYFDEAKKKGFQFPRETQELLNKGQRIHLLDALGNVKVWDEPLIYARTDNILSLAWDKVAPWLFD